MGKFAVRKRVVLKEFAIHRKILGPASVIYRKGVANRDEVTAVNGHHFKRARNWHSRLFQLCMIPEFQTLKIKKAEPYRDHYRSAQPNLNPWREQRYAITQFG